MSENTIRYFVGYASDLYGMRRDEVEGRSYEDRVEAEEAVVDLDVERPWSEVLAEMVHEIDLNDYPNE